MRITLLGKRNGRRVICWKSWLKLTLATMVLGALLATGAYVVFAQRWNPIAPLGGLGAGFVASLVALIANFFTPIYRLPTIGH